MKIKLDENLPARLVPLLAKLGHQVDTVADEGLTGKPDSDVWHRVIQEPVRRIRSVSDNPPWFLGFCQWVDYGARKLRRNSGLLWMCA